MAKKYDPRMIGITLILISLLFVFLFKILNICIASVDLFGFVRFCVGNLIIFMFLFSLGLLILIYYFMKWLLEVVTGLR